MTSSGTAPAYRRLSVDQRRTQLIAAALGLFAQHRPEHVSLDGVAAEAGVSRPLVYRYFPGGKQQLYEAALRSAADELEQCFHEPRTGPLTLRLRRALDRYLAFVDEHDAGFTALLRGGSVVSTSRTDAIVDEVRRVAAEQILLHLDLTGAADVAPDGAQEDGRHAERAGARLRLTVRTWITAVEAASLIWLDEGKQPPLGELRDWLVDVFVAQLTTTAARDEHTARTVEHALRLEQPDGPVGDLARRALPVADAAARLLGGES